MALKIVKIASFFKKFEKFFVHKGKGVLIYDLFMKISCQGMSSGPLGINFGIKCGIRGAKAVERGVRTYSVAKLKINQNFRFLKFFLKNSEF